MSEFIKYKSIENDYRQKHINDMFMFHPQYRTCQYILTEKLDGANFQIKFTNNGFEAPTVELGKRTGMIKDGESLHSHHVAMERPEMVTFVANISYLVQSGMNDGDTITFYGELFGEGIQGRINYGEGKRILFFDCMHNDQYLTQMDFFHFMDDLESTHLQVPIIGMFDSFDEAMAYDVENKPTLLNPVEGNNSEGAVIKPYDIICKNKDDEQVLFYIKHKTVEFAEKMNTKRPKPRKEIEPELQEAMHTFAEHLTDSRLLSVFSKEGTIEEPSEMGKYIKLLMADAREDYLKDYKEQFLALEDKQRAQVFKCAGKVGAELLKKYL